MATQQELLIKIRGDIADIQKKLGTVQGELGKTQKASSGFVKAFASVGKAVAVAGAAVGGAALLIGKKSLDAAAYVEEMENKFNVVFKNSASDMDAWADSFADAIGRNKTEIKSAVANQSDLMIGMGMTEDVAGDLSKKYTELAYDLASFNNVNDATAIEAMTKAMMGETEMAKSLGLNLSVTTMEQSEYVKALGKSWKEMTQAEKAEAYYQEAIKQSTNAIGDAERSSGSYTNQVKKLQSKKQELYETIGSKLLPIFTPLVTKMAEMVDKVIDGVKAFSDIYTETGSAAEALKGFFEAIGLDKLAQVISFCQKWKDELTALGIFLGFAGLAILAFNIYTNWAAISMAVATAAGTAFGAVMAFITSPITLVILAIGALIAIGYLLYKNWEEISAWLKATWETIKQKAVEIWGAIDAFLTEKLGAIWTNIKEVVGNIWNYWKTTWENVKNLFKGVWDGVKQIFGAFKSLFSGDWKGFWEGIKGAFSTIWESIKTFFSNQLTNFMNLFKNIIPSMLQIGKDVITGLLNGLKNAWSAVTGWISEKANWVKDKFKSILGIKSPSREFMKIGMYVDEGLVKGLEDGEVDINQQVKGMAEGLKTGFAADVEGTGQGIGATSSATTINLNGSYMFQDKESMDYFLNKMALAVQRG